MTVPSLETAAGEYAAYGLRVRSALPLPFSAADGRRADVEVVFGETPAALPVPWRGRHRPWQAVPGAFLLTVPEVARYFATGSRIVVEPCGGRDAAMAAFLAKQVLAAILQQRGMMPLHASAVADERGAMVFLGAPGSGKSTLLAALTKRGYLAVADDVLGMTIADGVPVALPGLPEVRLRPDSQRALGLLSQPLPRGATACEKRCLQADRPASLPTPIRAFYVLGAGAGNGVGVRLEAPAAARDIVANHRYRGFYGQLLGTALAQRRTLDAAVAAAGTYRLWRHSAAPLDAAIEGLSDQVEAHWAAVTERLTPQAQLLAWAVPETTRHAARP